MLYRRFGGAMKYYEKNTLVRDIHTGAILIIIGSHFRNSTWPHKEVKRTIVYRCVEPHKPKHVYMRQHEELMEVK
jgi:hypothetical protein